MTRNCRRNTIGFSAAFGAFLSLSLAAPAWAVPFISVIESEDGGPVSLSTSGIDIAAGSLVIGTETVSFTGTLHIPFGDGVLFDPLYSFVLGEPGGGVSDFATVTPLGFGGPVGPDWQQGFDYFFTSEDGLGLPSTVNCTVEEDGTLQTCSLFSQSGANILDLKILSSPGEVPEPSTLALLGAGLLVGALRRRRKAKA